MAAKPAPPRPVPRLYLATPVVDDPSQLMALLPGLLAAADVAAVLLRLRETDQRTMISRVKALVPAVQDGGAALLLDGHVELVARAGADGAHVNGIAALEDALPGGIEAVNPNLALIGRFLQMPAADPSDRVLGLSHSEMRDQATLLYFDDFEPGTGTYSVLARATAAGTFRWPATQVYPMYDSRFSGLSPSSICVISGE